MVTHAELLEVVEDIHKDLLKSWNKDRRLEPLALTWPSEPVKSVEGRLVFGAIICQLRNVPVQEWTAALQKMVGTTKAAGLFLVERRDQQIRALFETHEGARAWLTPLHRHGDLLALGETVVHDNAECVGILWRPARGTA